MEKVYMAKLAVLMSNPAMLMIHWLAFAWADKSRSCEAEVFETLGVEVSKDAEQGLDAS